MRFDQQELRRGFLK